MVIDVPVDSAEDSTVIVARVSGLEEHRGSTFFDISCTSGSINIPSGTLDMTTNVFIFETALVLRNCWVP